MPLTDTQCRTAKPKEKPYKLTDGNSLYLEVKPNGVKAWRAMAKPGRKASSPLGTMWLSQREKHLGRHRSVAMDADLPCQRPVMSA